MEAPVNIMLNMNDWVVYELLSKKAGEVCVDRLAQIDIVLRSHSWAPAPPSVYGRAVRRLIIWNHGTFGGGLCTSPIWRLMP